MLDLNKEQREQYVKKVTGMAVSLGFKVSGAVCIWMNEIVCTKLYRVLTHARLLLDYTDNVCAPGFVLVSSVSMLPASIFKYLLYPKGFRV